MGDGWSLAYRTFDAQYWGVPQRRRRIYLVADFRGQRAGKILFEREGLRGHFAEGRTPRQGVAADAERGANTADRENRLTPCTLKIRSGCEGGGKGALVQENMSATLSTNNDQYLFVPIASAGFKAGQGAQARSVGWETEKAPTIAAEAGGNSIPSACIAFAQNQRNEVRNLKDVASALAAEPGMKQQTFVAIAYDARGNGDGKAVNTIVGDHERRITDYTTLVCAMRAFGDYQGSDITSSLKARDYKDATDLVVCIQGNCIDRADTAGCNGKGWTENVSYTLNTIDRPAVAYEIDRHSVRYIVRRLTPTECARLQGFPDKWGHPDRKDELTDEEYQFWKDVRNTHALINGKPTKEYTKAQMLAWYGKLHTDSAEYKMWGNGIALPNALYVMQGIADALIMEAQHG